MAFPVVEEITYQGFTSASRTHNVNMPATVNAGDLLFVWFVLQQEASTRTITVPGGWTTIHNGRPTSGIVCCLAVRAADGSEDGGSYNFSTAASVRAAAYVGRIRQGTWAGDESTDVDGVVAGGSGDPNPPSVSAGWGADDNLYIALAGGNNNTTATAPSSYGNLQDDSFTASLFYSLTVAVATRELNASSDDPGTFNYSSNPSVWSAATIVIKPAPPAYSGSGAISADAAVAGSGEKHASGSGAISAFATAAATGAVGGEAKSGSGAIDADATPAASGTKHGEGSGAVAADASVSGAGTKAAGGAGDAESVAEAASVGAKAGSGTGATEAEAAVAAAGASARAGSGAAASDAVVAGAGAKAASGTGSAEAEGTVAGSGERASSGTGSVATTATVAGSGSKQASGIGAFEAESAVAGTGWADVPASGSGAIAATATVAASGKKTAFRLEGGSGRIGASGRGDGVTGLREAAGRAVGTADGAGQASGRLANLPSAPTGRIEVR